MMYNKGEWSELYTLFVIFRDKKIPAANSNLEPTSEFYNFLEIIRGDGLQGTQYYNLEGERSVTILNDKREIIKVIGTDNLPSKTKKILAAIKNNEKGTFTIPEATSLMRDYELTKVKANSTIKSDIDAIVQDKISSRRRLGFSVKSKLGGASTLMNASSHTGFRFKVIGINDYKSINALNGVKDKIMAIQEQGGSIKYQNMASQTFKGNLRLMDTVLPSVTASIIAKYYAGEARSISDLCKAVAEDNEFELTEKDVSFKVKNLLRAIALGMVPGKPWDTRLSTYGGYIVVKNTGELVCYHLYNDDEFKDYLFNNTKLDTPDAKRHNFGYLFSDNGELWMDLNFQIRFVR